MGDVLCAVLTLNYFIESLKFDESKKLPTHSTELMGALATLMNDDVDERDFIGGQKLFLA
jgi:hypothetical protein